MLPLGKLSPKTPWDPRRARGRILDLDDWNLLTLIIKSPLVDVPRALLTEEQIASVRRGEKPKPTASQRRASGAVWGGARG